ncbi:hypothetical protein Aple_064050 [Acrocarpospora pleiomorpha]|uniref:Uncharacterized protein n=1 Tax=Acrocarpospora pleiomorpha TaxID=90975 RepID=A0A5M3XRU7_9ACTN|nr:hypothetical protein [Acrocarpospora pleiomorpha]GES23506.1 hypothetical protein Aple_064050 [Acrocarpospora pleiomorpha]
MAVSDDPPPPAPEGATGWPEFTEKLRELHAWCGRPKYATLSKNSGLAPSAISNLIGRNPLSRPPEAATLRFVEACLTHGGRSPKTIQDQTRRWHAAWSALANRETAPAPAPRPVRQRQPIGVVVLAVAFGLAGALWGLTRSSAEVPFVNTAAPPGDAVPRCAPTSTTITDARQGQTWTGLYECPNTPGADVYEFPRTGVIVGQLESNPSWFVCWAKGERHQGGNDIWYYTQGDHSAGKRELDAWGYVPGFMLDTDLDPDPGLTRQCGFIEGVRGESSAGAQRVVGRRQ